MSITIPAGATIALSLLWLPGAGEVVENATGGKLLPSASWEIAVSVGSFILALGSAWLLTRQCRLGTLGLSARYQHQAADWLGLPTATRALVETPTVNISGLLARGDERLVDAGVRGVGRLATSGSRVLARFDDVVIDAGTRGVAKVAAATSLLFSMRFEWSFDGVVNSITALSIRSATWSRRTDEQVIDATVESFARVVGTAGQQSRRLQSGLAHHYYVMLAVGVAASVAFLGVLGLAAKS